MKIGELAKIAKCSAETIRFYEKEGLLPAAARTDNNYREYQQSHLERLRFIRNCRAFDMSHEEIRQLLQQVDSHADDCQTVNILLDEHILHIEHRIQELMNLKVQLQTLRQQCQQQQGIDECGIVQGLTNLELVHCSERYTHLG
jgi:Cd(II)/Pb(II)-responsive transcriptional regulator